MNFTIGSTVEYRHDPRVVGTLVGLVDIDNSVDPTATGDDIIPCAVISLPNTALGHLQATNTVLTHMVIALENLRTITM